MKNVSDFKIIKKIDEHFVALSKNYLGIKTIQDFLSDDSRKKVILFDLFQIGENVNHFSKRLQSKLNEKDISGLVSIRNYIAHGYDFIDYQIIKKVIEEELEPFINNIKRIARDLYKKDMMSILGKKVEVFIDRPIGYIHNNITYKLNYGYIKEIMAPDDEYQDVYIIDEHKQLSNSCFGTVIAIIHRKNDIEDKLVVSIHNKDYSIKEIKELTHFQERFFDIEITKSQ